MAAIINMRASASASANYNTSIIVKPSFSSSSLNLVNPIPCTTTLTATSSFNSRFPFLRPPHSSSSNLSGQESEVDGVHIEIDKLEKNSRRIRARVAIEAPLGTVWSVLTDYERLSEFIPGLALSQLLDQKPNYARLYQIGQQNLAFGLKFSAKGIVDCYEKELQNFPLGLKRDIEFDMLRTTTTDDEEETQTTLEYVVDVKPKLWLPVQLIEARLCNEIKLNLRSIREEAHKTLLATL
ncbi:hypothetical protein UlMin_045470 [Ulmus minor]